MKVLILGGTVFLGRHLVDAARSRGHEITLFNRGRSAPELFEDVEQLIGDRTSDLSALRGRRWDAVIDTCGFLPSVVRRSAELLAETVDLYIFISSISAYAEHPLSGIDEDAPLASMTEEDLREAERQAAEGANARSLGAKYGPAKVLCEHAAEQAMPGRVLQIRPGLIVGPYDPTDRFTWWVRRVAVGGKVLAPGQPGRLVRFIDARDLAEWTIRRVEAGDAGLYNAAGPTRGWTMGQLLETCKTVSRSDARFTWVGEDFLEKHKIGPWIQLPLWLPEEYNGFFAVRNDRAMAAGLTFRPLPETVRDTLEWDRAESPESPESDWNTGLDPSLEQDLLRRFSAEPS